MKKSLLLLIISRISDNLLRRVFWVHGTWIAYKRGGPDGVAEYWHEVAYINDVKLNVVGQHLLNQRLSKNRVFGNPFMTVSAAKHVAKLEDAGLKWKALLNKLDPNHCEKAYQSYKENITKAYNELL